MPGVTGITAVVEGNTIGLYHKCPPQPAPSIANGTFTPMLCGKKRYFQPVIFYLLNATDINFAVFNRFLFPGELEGYFFALFSIAISAAETAIAIAIMINIYRNIRSIQVKNLDELKW